ncbi:hypothetical protein [Herbaspirillum huttiense]|uniref:DNA ligase n=1 Tax=Herbaspirillum huttiense subsp. lycopersici TaxID=3074428 RepID=A0ABU2EFT4_9BURK|nr:hypothetical protein [Herbaspirillum huttiense]MDR9846986.1 hypothetical protein [Herbaspirillum huttiense SE1]
MNTNEILDLIDSVAATSSKNDKIAMLKACSGSELLKRVLKATYEPLISYGIRAVPERSHAEAGGAQFDAQTWGIIEMLADRRLTGNGMHAAVLSELNRLTAKSAELFKRIILKDMRAGFSEETCNKVWPGLVQDFPYMRCSLPKDAKLETWDWAAGHVSQQKADGMFVNVNHEESGAVFIYSRQGTMFPMEKFEALVNAVVATLARGTQNHGELLVKRGDVILAREIGNGILNKVVQGGDFGPDEVPVMWVWDQIPLAAVKSKGKHEVPYKARLAAIINQLKGKAGAGVELVPTKIVKSYAEAMSHATEIMQAGGEGTILKKGDAIWRDGTSKEQVKLKLEFEVDLKIVAVQEGKANSKNAGRAGALTCETADGLLRVDVAIKGEKMRDAVDADHGDWIGRIMPVIGNMILKPSPSNDLHSIFLPRFAESNYRKDKTYADDLARALAIEDAAKGIEELKQAA